MEVALRASMDWRIVGLGADKHSVRITAPVSAPPARAAPAPIPPVAPTSTVLWLPVALVVMVAIAKVVLADTMDPDAFWHLRVADQLLRDGIGPLVDSLSFASLKSPWTPYSWLAELFMRAVWLLTGLRGVLVVTSLCAATILTLTAYSARLSRQDSHAMPVLLATVVAAYFTLPFLSFRPVTFALALMAIVVALLWRHRRMDYRSRAVWCIPALALLITNLHIYIVFVVMLVMVMTIGVFFDRRERFMPMLWLVLATGVAACATPMPGGVVQTILNYQTIDPMVASNFITEMRPFYTGAGGKVTLAVLIGLVGLAVVRRREMEITDWLLLIFATVVLFRLGRFSPLFSLIAMPIFARVLPALTDRTLRRPPVRAVMAIVLVVGVFSIGRGMVNTGTFEEWLNRHTPDVPGYPTASAQWVSDNVEPVHRRLVNEFNWGGYLAWRLGDRWQVLMDGRTQLYAPDFWRQVYFSTPEAQLAVLSDQPADAAILPARRSAFLENLERAGWRRVHEDAVAIVLLPPTH